MFRHVAEPFHTRGLETDIGVEAAGDSAMDDGLLLLLQQFNQLLLGADVAPNAPVGVVEETYDGRLLCCWWQRTINHLEMLRSQTPHIRSNSV